ncbi:MAG: hypothetical protein Q9M50_05620 [Methylococcales bacterium]|nr:hypothetical protein [Methylococcales bacterium]
MNSFYLKLFVAFIFSILSLTSQAESKTDKKEAAVLQLPAEIKPLLLEEMQQLQQGMMNLIPAVVSGNWEEITHIAKKNATQLYHETKINT